MNHASHKPLRVLQKRHTTCEAYSEIAAAAFGHVRLDVWVVGSAHHANGVVLHNRQANRVQHLRDEGQQVHPEGEAAVGSGGERFTYGFQEVAPMNLSRR